MILLAHSNGFSKQSRHRAAWRSFQGAVRVMVPSPGKHAQQDHRKRNTGLRAWFVLRMALPVPMKTKEASKPVDVGDALAAALKRYTLVATRFFDLGACRHSSHFLTCVGGMDLTCVEPGSATVHQLAVLMTDNMPETLTKQCIGAFKLNSHPLRDVGSNAYEVDPSGSLWTRW